ncbi:MAG: hypothetical protein N3E50_09815 [Candidatus Goldbacteria bacterium]|nr:hypothetical protein [Candidatus Goldiibacteriota bacterium]
MIKKIFLLQIILIICFSIIFAQEEDTITDIEEQKHYEKDKYAIETRGDTLTIKKGEGFDFKIPEILITGQIDTKILLKRETGSLENLEDVKSVLYEKGKVNMPYSYLNEERFSPHFQDISNIRDFFGKLKLTAGSYNTLMADGMLGKYFNENNRFIAKLYHLNYDNEIINNRNTYVHLNSFSGYYGTKYDEINALYKIKFNINQYSNPYPLNDFLSLYNLKDFNLGVNFSGNIGDVTGDISLLYNYFDQINSNNVFLYKENRLNLKFYIEKDFNVEQQKRVKATLNGDLYWGENFLQNKIYNPIYLDFLFKSILYFEPFILQGGVRMQQFKQAISEFRMSPYVFASYDFISGLSFYAIFKPQMNVILNIEELKQPFIIANDFYKPALERINFISGININFMEMFFDIYYGFKSVSDYIFLNNRPGDYIFTYYNCNLDYSFCGISFETLRIKEFKILLDYIYNNIISSTSNVTYIPYNTLILKFIYQPVGWELTASAKGETAQYGTISELIPPYMALDLSVSKIISDNFTVTGYINNVLNNNYYLLYYYQQRKLNLGLGAILKF